MKNWQLQTTINFSKQLKKIDRSHQIRILSFLKNRVLNAENPKSLAKSMTGDLSGYWRFRIGDYRVIADIQDDVCTIVALDVGHRRYIYN